jgi:lipopolysaccharide transport system permease protein
VFGQVVHLPSEGVPYFVFAFAGLLGWNAFDSTFTKASGSLVANAALVSKVFFPRVLLPLSVVGSTVIDFGVALAMMAVLLVAAGLSPGLGILLLPVWLCVMVLAALGAGLLATSLAVRYRDVQYVVPVATQLLFFASPVAYSVRTVPASARTLLLANPLAGALEGFRWSLLGTGRLQVGAVVYSIAASMAVFLVGSVAFTRMERRFADVI